MPTEKVSSPESIPISREDILLEVAAILKNKRQEDKLTIEVVANALNLRKVYLQALESGDWSEMPGEVYALGFLRQYAIYLHLDLDDSIEKLKSGDYQLTKPLTFPDPAIAPNKTWMGLAGLLFILLFIGFNAFNQQTSPLPSQLLQDSSEQLLQPEPSRLTTDKPQESAEIAKPKENIIKIQQSTKKPVKDIQASQEILSYKYILTAVSSDVWLQLHESGEPPILVREVLLRKGQSMSIEHPKVLVLTCGKPRSLEINLNGQVIFQVNELGKKGKVLRNYPLKKLNPT